jgi:hypothetical protein
MQDGRGRCTLNYVKANGKKALKIHCLGAIKAMSTV